MKQANNLLGSATLMGTEDASMMLWRRAAYQFVELRHRNGSGGYFDDVLVIERLVGL
ncbi:MAG: hypothetical protein MR982_06435 [Bacteroides pyogenes]|uniref:hypothetical protein n=1 Tax=Bacteroides pyogenes TaxID=310300 RepID=UPI00242B670B|nr:hypothetical protein [Bacteroides pyogenes]MCI7070590.1 hypothetical protein [Bacteroides pyogenes]MDY5352815.1 hypothetical protein [Bacteroides pyogenes]